MSQKANSDVSEVTVISDRRNPPRVAAAAAKKQLATIPNPVKPPPKKKARTTVAANSALAADAVAVDAVIIEPEMDSQTVPEVAENRFISSESDGESSDEDSDGQQTEANGGDLIHAFNLTSNKKRKKSSKRSWVWLYFDDAKQPIEGDGDESIKFLRISSCKICDEYAINYLFMPVFINIAIFYKF